MTPLNPVGFWSYTSQDDTSSRGRLSQLRRLLADDLQQAIGKTPVVQIFQDVAAIPPGADWEKQIHSAIGGASFFIPIMTPGFLQSEWCARELLAFRDREKALNCGDLIFPIHYSDVEDFEMARRAELHDPEVWRLLRSRQWVDFRDLRYSDVTKEEVARRIGVVSTGIRGALYRPVRSQPRAPGAEVVATEHVATMSVPDPKPRIRIKAWTRPAQWLGIVAGIIGGSTILYDWYTPPTPPSPIAQVLAPAPPIARSYLIFFDWDKASLTDRAKQIVALIVDGWQQLPDTTKIEVNGYDDTSQTSDIAMGNSIRRAQAVAAELVIRGVPRNSITVQGFGNTKPLVPTGPGVREPQNRRVEVILR